MSAIRSATLDMVVTTNNGVEAQNRTFKYEYLFQHRTKYMTGLLTVIVEDFCLILGSGKLTSTTTHINAVFPLHVICFSVAYQFVVYILFNGNTKLLLFT